jgi:DNA topoisomerase-1
MKPKFYKKPKYSAANVQPFTTTAAYLIIVESPSKCKKIEEYLGSEYCCIATKGHIRNIEGLKSIDIKSGNGSFVPTFTLLKDKVDVVTHMRDVISHFNASNIYLATDDDREGEGIAWHICEEFGLNIKTTHRIIFHEVTKPALVYAVKNPVKLNMQLVYAQHARQVLDVIVGYKISPFLWKYIFSNKANTLSAGRCQTPALRLVYDNEQERLLNNVEMRYKTNGYFFSKSLSFELNHEFISSNEVQIFLSKSANFAYNLTIGIAKETKQSPPAPFTTSRLLQVANNVLHISPKETMSLCQILYQSGHITYMRTESSLYSPIFIEQAKQYIVTKWNNDSNSLDYVGNLDKLTNEKSANPHEAIRVTHIDLCKMDADNPKLAAVYKLIWKNTIESCMAEFRCSSTPVTITAPCNYLYKSSVDVPIFLGWKKAFEKLDPESNSGLLLYLTSIGSPISYNKINSIVVIRNKHQYYSESTLIHKLEELGIGRPSTFASIVDIIQDRGYIKQVDVLGTTRECSEYELSSIGEIITTIRERIFGNDKKRLVIQPTGVLTCDFLVKHFDTLFSYEYTKIMETQLDLVVDETTFANICKSCYKEINNLSKLVNGISKQTYKIDDYHVLAFDKYGPVIHKSVHEGNNEYVSVKKDIILDFEKLKAGAYCLTDLIEIENNNLGKIDGHDVILKSGQYGPYVEWGDNCQSVKSLKKAVADININDIENIVSASSDKPIDKNILRTLNESMSVRKGKFSPYVYYKRPDMAKPMFLNIKQFKEGYFTCDKETLVDWVCNTYKLLHP